MLHVVYLYKNNGRSGNQTNRYGELAHHQYVPEDRCCFTGLLATGYNLHGLKGRKI